MGDKTQAESLGEAAQALASAAAALGDLAKAGPAGSYDTGEGSETAPGGRDEDTAESQPVPEESAEQDPKSLFWDPYAIVEQLGYKDRASPLTYGTLKQMAYRMPVATAIIQTRLHQVGSFCRPQRDRYGLGFRIQLRDPRKQPTKEDLKWIQQMSALMLRTGVTESPRGRDNLETMVKKMVWDSYCYDQVGLEVVPDREGRPAEWYAVDGATLRIADSASIRTDEDDQKAIRHVQVYDGMVITEYNQAELAFGVRNPRTDLRLYGYGVCLHPDSRVATGRGLERVEELSGTEFKVSLQGRLYSATAFPTGKKKVIVLRLKDNREIRASIDHQIYFVTADGRWDWVRLGDLKPGDYVATDVAGIEGGEELGPWKFEPSQRQTSKPWGIDRAGADLWEVLGWLVGDGCLVIKEGRFKGKAVSIAYAESEKDIAERHREVLRKYNIPDALYLRNDGLYGEIKFNHEGFGCWLLSEVGLKPRSGGLPSAVFGLPLEQRCAFLRGLFSADGHVTRNDLPTLGCTDRVLNQDVQRLLLSVGLRSRWHHKRVKKDIGSGPKLYDGGGLYVYDKLRFFELIGFLQDHKRPTLDYYQGTRADVVSPNFARRAAQYLKDNGKSDRRIRGLLEDPPRWGVTRGWLGSRLPPDWGGDLRWSQTEVTSVRPTDEWVEMYDVSVASDFHGFVVDGVLVHNSELEMGITAITALLFGFQYNQKQFTQGSIPKGLLNLKGTIQEKQLRAFRRYWMMMTAGIENAGRMPVLNAENVQWHPMVASNRDMEYNAWIDFQIKVLSALFLMDPSEINFRYGNTGQSSTMNEAKNKEKIVESKERGLRPMLRFIADIFNRFIIWPINEAFEFEFVGLDARTHEEIADLTTKQVKTIRTIDELRAEDDLPPLKDGKGEVILDPTWLQNAQQVDAQAEEAAADEEGAPEGGEEGFDDEALRRLLSGEGGGSESEEEPEKKTEAKEGPPKLADLPDRSSDKLGKGLVEIDIEL